MALVLYYERFHAAQPMFLPFGNYRGNDGVENCRVVSEMNPPYGIPCSMILERVTKPVVKVVNRTPLNGSTTSTPVHPIWYRITPEVLKLRSIRATSNQWWQMRSKLYEPFGNPPKSPLYGMMFRLGWGRVDTFNREFRARLSRIMAFRCSAICLFNARMDSRLISRSIAVRKQELWGASRFCLLTSATMPTYDR